MPDPAEAISMAGLAAIGSEDEPPGAMFGVASMPLVFAGVLVGELLRSQPAIDKAVATPSTTASRVGRLPHRWLKNMITLGLTAGAKRSPRHASAETFGVFRGQSACLQVAARRHARIGASQPARRPLKTCNNLASRGAAAAPSARAGANASQADQRFRIGGGVGVLVGAWTVCCASGGG